jgi:hypothetical protein
MQIDYNTDFSKFYSANAADKPTTKIIQMGPGTKLSLIDSVVFGNFDILQRMQNNRYINEENLQDYYSISVFAMLDRGADLDISNVTLQVFPNHLHFFYFNYQNDIKVTNLNV